MQMFVRDKLFTVHGYPQDKVELLDSFPYRRFDGPLDKTYVATGFNFDDGGEQAEMGSDLLRRVFTVELFVFAPTAVWGNNVASLLRSDLEDGLVPLRDIAVEDDPVIDQLIVDRVVKERQPVQDPQPWEENVWLVTVKIEDEYSAALA